MIKEYSERAANYSLAITLGIPGDAEARLNVVLVGLDSLLQSQQVVGGQSQSLWRLELRRDLDIVTNAIVDGQIMAHAPAVLPEDANRDIVKCIAGAAESLNVISREPGPISLDGGKSGEVGEKAGGGIDKSELHNFRLRDAPNVKHSAVVHGERSLQRQVVEVSTELGVVPPDGPRKVVSDLIALLGALNIRIRFASEISIAGNVDRRVRPAWNLCVIE